MGENYYWKIETDIGSATTHNSFHVTNHLTLLDDYITSDVSGIGYYTGPFEGPPDSYLFDTTNIVTQLELTKGEEFGKLGYYVESDSLPSFINDVLHILSNNPSNSGVYEFETSFDPSARKHCLLRINTQTDDLYYYCWDWFPITHHYKMWGTIE